MRSFKSDASYFVKNSKNQKFSTKAFNIFKRHNASNQSEKSNIKLYEDTGMKSICCTKCLKALSHSINIIKALIMRLVFSLHSFIAICTVYVVNQELWCLVNVVGVVFLIIELFVTIIRRKGKEPKW